VGDDDGPLRERPVRSDLPETAELVEAYGECAYRLALRVTGTAADAMDVVEEVLQMAATLPSQASADRRALGPWLRRATARAAYRTLRARRPGVADIVMDDVLPAVGGDGHFVPMEDWSARVDETSLSSGISDVVAAALDALPPDDRTALVLHDVEAMSACEVADILGAEVGAVRARIHRARLFVRKWLSEHLAAAAGA
jgi:RNA polymerase sigma-70 factor (ECF subfamily)